MRDFTPEEKELIASTPITAECFDTTPYDDKLIDFYIHAEWKNLTEVLERVRCMYNETKDERYFTELVRLLPNSYKVVKL